jgi:hypothetical protein
MSQILNTTAGTLKAILCFIDPEKTPKIAYDKDEYAIPLIEKIKSVIGDKDGSQYTFISFDDDETELLGDSPSILAYLDANGDEKLKRLFILKNIK